MGTTSTIVKKVRLFQITSAEGTEGKKARKKGLLFDVISSVLVISAGVAVYKATGLYDGVSSTAGKIGLGAAISFTYLAVFRRSLISE
jgi:hypothetical protein